MFLLFFLQKGEDYMGFLDNLLSKGAKKLINNVVDNAVDRITDKFDEKTGNTVASNNTVKPAQNEKSRKKGCSPAEIMARLDAIIARDYSSYEIRKNVSPTTIGATDEAKNYTYGLYYGGAPKLFIMIAEHNQDALRTYRLAKNAALNNGIGYVNFLTQFPNTEEYIKNRLAENIK